MLTTIEWMGVVMFDGIGETMNGCDEVWRQVQQKYVMSRVIKNLHSIEKTTALTLLLPTIIDWINKRINDRDAVWRWVHRKYVMISIIKK